MRKRTCLYVAGGVVFGFAAYCAYKHFRKKNNTECNSFEEVTCDPVVTPQSAVVSDFEQVQKHAAESIRKNHADAAQQLSEIVDDVMSNSVEVKETNDQAAKDLDALMK